MPDATYVGAGMPCGNCGNPLTPGQPHKCGRTPDFDRRLDESWEPSPAASPDERLREALALVYVMLTGAEPMWAEMPLDERCARAANEAQQAFLAADREATDEPYDPYTPAEEGLPDPGPCTDPAFIDPSSGPGVIEQSRVIERSDDA